MNAPTRSIAPGITMLVTGLAMSLGAIPVGFFSMVMGAFMCDSPSSNVMVCTVVAYAPPALLALVGLVVAVLGIVAIVRARRAS